MIIASLHYRIKGSLDQVKYDEKTGKFLYKLTLLPKTLKNLTEDKDRNNLFSLMPSRVSFNKTNNNSYPVTGIVKCPGKKSKFTYNDNEPLQIIRAPEGLLFFTKEIIPISVTLES